MLYKLPQILQKPVRHIFFRYSMHRWVTGLQVFFENLCLFTGVGVLLRGGPRKGHQDAARVDIRQMRGASNPREPFEFDLSECGRSSISNIV